MKPLALLPGRALYTRRVDGGAGRTGERAIAGAPVFRQARHFVDDKGGFADTPGPKIENWTL